MALQCPTALFAVVAVIVGYQAASAVVSYCNFPSAPQGQQVFFTCFFNSNEPDILVDRLSPNKMEIADCPLNLQDCSIMDSSFTFISRNATVVVLSAVSSPEIVGSYECVLRPQTEWPVPCNYAVQGLPRTTTTTTTTTKTTPPTTQTPPTTTPPTTPPPPTTTTTRPTTTEESTVYTTTAVPTTLPAATTTTVAPTTTSLKVSQSETHQQPTTETELTTSGFQASDDAAVRFTFIPHGVILLVAAGFVIIVVVNVVVVWRRKKMTENTESERENLESQRQSSIYDEVQDPPPPPTTKPPLFKRKTPESPRNQSNLPIQNTNQSPPSATAFNQSASAIPAISQSAAEVQTVDALAPPTGHAFHKLSALASGSEQLAFGGDQRQVINLLDLLNRSLAEDSTGQENAATVLLNLQQRLAAFQSPGSHFHPQGGRGGNSPGRPAQDPAVTFQGTPFARPPQANITANQIGPRANIDQSQSTLEDFDGYLQPIASQHTLSKQRVDAVKATMSLRDTNLDKEKSSPTPCLTAADTYLNPVLSTKEAAGNKGTAFRDPTMIDDPHSLNHQQTLKAENTLQKPNTQEHPAYLTLISPPEDEERYTTVQDTL